MLKTRFPMTDKYWYVQCTEVEKEIKPEIQRTAKLLEQPESPCGCRNFRRDTEQCKINQLSCPWADSDREAQDNCKWYKD